MNKQLTCRDTANLMRTTAAFAVLACCASLSPTYADPPPTKAAPNSPASTLQPVSLDALYQTWKNYCSSHGEFNRFDAYVNNPPFQALQARGTEAVTYFIHKAQQGEDFEFFPFGQGVVLSSITKLTFNLKPVPTPENPKLTVFAVPEFPGVEVDRKADDFAHPYLLWWAQKDRVTPIWFAQRYQTWKTLKEHPETSVKYRQHYADAKQLVRECSISALPLCIKKLDEDPQEAPSVVEIISYLTSGVVSPTAKPAEVKAWWAKNKATWTFPAGDDPPVTGTSQPAPGTGQPAPGTEPPTKPATTPP